MNFKLLALIAFATTVIAAPASEDAPADLVHTQAGNPSHAFEPFANPQVNAEARGEPEYYEEPHKSPYYQGLPKSPYYQGQPSGKCKTPLCCQPLKENTGAVVNLKGPLAAEPVNSNTVTLIDPDTTTGMYGLKCNPITGYIGTW
jgi:hypothetical protein